MTTKICFVVAGNVKSLRKISFRMRWYQVDGITEDVQTACMSATRLGYAYIVSCFNSDCSNRN